MARPRDDDRDAGDDADIVRLLDEAAGMLPAGADLGDFRQLLGGGDVAAAWAELRDRAAEQPTPFGFWVPMSKAGDLLGIP